MEGKNVAAGGDKLVPLWDKILMELIQLIEGVNTVWHQANKK